MYRSRICSRWNPMSALCLTAWIYGSNPLVGCAHPKTWLLMPTNLVYCPIAIKPACSTRATRDISATTLRARSPLNVHSSHTYLAPTVFSTSGIRKARESSLPMGHLLFYSAISHPISPPFVGLDDRVDWIRYKFSLGTQSHHRRYR